MVESTLLTGGTGMHRTRWIAIGALSVAAVGAGTGIAVAGGNGDTSTPITGPALQKASAAALRQTGGGTVSASEIGDEEGYYEVEVRLDDGRHVDVHLDQHFNVIDATPDGPVDESSHDAGQ